MPDADSVLSPEVVTSTIYAPASSSGAIAVIRISGPEAGPAIIALAGRLPGPRMATLFKLRSPDTAEVLDSSLVFWFPAPASYTGEDVAELHIHGGSAVMRGVLDALTGVPGLRIAEPGEFTRRAFENGKLDLTAAEGVGDLVAAKTAAQRRQALAQMGGGLSRIYDEWRTELVRTLAHLEADIDFPDEDLPEGVSAKARYAIDCVAIAIGEHLADDGRGERIRDGFRIAILGAPNAGKSSLLNRLAGRDAAIVSTAAGTTRDVVEVRLDLAGYEVILSDTAGLRETADEVEREGVKRARRAGRDADLKLILVDAETASHIAPEIGVLIDDTAFVVVNKSDLVPGSSPLASELRDRAGAVFAVSAKTGGGVENLVEAVTREVSGKLSSQETASLTRARHREALLECRAALLRAGASEDIVLVAEDVRLAVRALGRITGLVDIDDILDVIFRDFCIGK